MIRRRREASLDDFEENNKTKRLTNKNKNATQNTENGLEFLKNHLDKLLIF